MNYRIDPSEDEPMPHNNEIVFLLSSKNWTIFGVMVDVVQQYVDEAVLKNGSLERGQNAEKFTLSLTRKTHWSISLQIQHP